MRKFSRQANKLLDFQKPFYFTSGSLTPLFYGTETNNSTSVLALCLAKFTQKFSSNVNIIIVNNNKNNNHNNQQKKDQIIILQMENRFLAKFNETENLLSKINHIYHNNNF